MTEKITASWKAGFFFTALMPLLLLIDSSMGYISGWRPVGAIEHIIPATAVTGLLLSLLTAASQHGRAFFSRYRGEILLLMLASTLGWALLETGAHFAIERLNRDRFFHTRGPNLHRIITPDPDLLPGIHGVSHFTTGPDGIRASRRPVPGDYRILCVGGSTTECVNLDDHETWEALLMQRLNNRSSDQTFNVGNAGVSGFDTHEHLQFVRTSPLLEYIDMVIFQTGINDLWRFLCGEEERIAYGRFERPLNPDPQEETVDAAPETWQPIWARSRVIQCWHDLRRAMQPQPEPDPVTVEGIGGEEYRIRRQRRAEAELTDKLPDLEPGRESYGNRIRALIHACRRRGVRPVFTTQPVLWRADLSTEEKALCWFGWLEDGRYLTIARLRQAMDQYNQTLSSICAGEDVICIDLASMNGRPEFFNDDCHFTEKGAAETARLMAEQLPDSIFAEINP